MSNIAIIGARANSKEVPDKNIREIKGHPLLAYSIGAAILSKKIDRVIFTTDSDGYAKTALKYGEVITVLRPPYLAQDNTPDHPFVLHALFSMQDISLEDNVVLLRPTTPFRDIETIDTAISEFEGERRKCDSLRSVTKADVVPEKLYIINDDGLLETSMGNTFDESNLPRGNFGSCFTGNGYVDVIRVDTLIIKGFYGETVLAFPMGKTVDIDTINDLEEAGTIDVKNEYKELFEYLESRV